MLSLGVTQLLFVVFQFASFGQPQNTINMLSQFQPVSHMQTPAVPVSAQAWLPPGSQGLPVASPVLPTGQQPSAPAGTVPVCSQLLRHTIVFFKFSCLSVTLIIRLFI